MMCQREGCERGAMLHITEVADGEAVEVHLCKDHAEEYMAQETRIREQLQKAGPFAFEPPISLASQLRLERTAKLFHRLTAEEAAAVLVPMLKHLDAEVRWFAAVSLGRYGRGIPESAAALQGALQDTDTDVRAAAAWALTQV